MNYFATALLVIGVPTTVAMGKMDVLAKLGPKKALQYPLVLFMVTMPAFAFICQTPATKPIAWFFTIPLGVAFGSWHVPARTQCCSCVTHKRVLARLVLPRSALDLVRTDTGRSRG